MWFNSTQRAEPYQDSDMEVPRDEISRFLRGHFAPGAAWLSSARVVRCWVPVPQRAQPSPSVAIRLAGHSGRNPAADKPEEGGDDVKSSWPLCPGLHTCYNGGDSGKPGREAEPISKSRLSSDCTLQLGCMAGVRSLIIADQHAAVNTFPGLYAHLARHTMGVGLTLSCGAPTRKGAAKSTVGSATGVKS